MHAFVDAAQKTCANPTLRKLLVVLASVVAGSTSVKAAEPCPSVLTKFTPYPGNPVFAAAGDGHWDVRIRERGWILFDPEVDDGQPAWRMWYTGYDGTREGLKQLGLATSSDGIHWTRHPGNPMSGEHWVEDLMIVPHQGTLYMFAEGRDDQAHLLTSTDGVAWERVGPLDIRYQDGTPIAAGPRGTPTAWYENGTWYLFYERFDAGVWLATSRDMRVWRNVQDGPVLVPGPYGYDQDLIALNQIIHHGGLYYAAFHGSKSGTRLWSTGLAVSSDLVHWKKCSGNPLFPEAENKSSGILVHDGTGFRLYTMHDQVHLHLPAGKR